MEQVLLLLVNFDADEVRPVALDAKAEAETIAKHVNIEEPNAALVALDVEVLRHYGDDRALPYGATEPAKAESPDIPDTGESQLENETEFMQASATQTPPAEEVEDD